MKNTLTIVLLTTITFFLTINDLCIAESKTPLDWREPYSSEINVNDNNQEWRKSDTARYLFVKGDFNGDGKEDIAKILIRKKDRAVGLFVFVSNATYQLDILTDPLYIHCMGLSLVKRGKYLTACGKGYDCDPGNPKEIYIKHDAINYFKEGSGNYYFYWDKNKERFKRMLMSD